MDSKDRADGDGRRESQRERYMREREQSTQYFLNENGFRYNRGKEGDLAWRPLDYTEDDYREDNSQNIRYGERYGFAAYGRANYDPNANREFEDPRSEGSEPSRYNYTWSNDEPFNNREQDYRYHPDRYTQPGRDAGLRGRSTLQRGVPSGMEQFGGNAQHMRGEHEQRRDQHEQRRDQHEQMRDHRGRGPKNYTRSDDRIREEVSERLMRDANVDPTDVEVLVTDGEVILKGTISDRPMKRRAEDIADMVMGVKDVRNELRLTGLTMKSDASDRDTNSTSDGRQHSVSQTEGARGGGKQTKTAS